MVHLKIDKFDAEAWIQSVQNDKFQDAIKGNWIIDEQGRVKAQSVLWLYCWAVTGMGSIDTAIEVQEVFDQIFPFTFSNRKLNMSGRERRDIQLGTSKPTSRGS